MDPKGIINTNLFQTENLKMAEQVENKLKLIEIMQKLLKTDDDLGFLSKLDKAEFEKLVACIRDRIDHRGNHS
jgi:hypothetical protein